MADLAPMLQALDQAGYRSTGPRRALVRLIAEQEGHFSAADLVRRSGAASEGIGRATIFRTLDVLSEAGIVERIDLPSGEHAYVACEPAHHHHVICRSCGASREIDDVGLRSISRAARRTGYRIEAHRLELFGTCPDCQARERS